MSANNSRSQAQRDWIVPAEIPFSELKSRDLEECVYWLLDAMGAKDLEWRTGGAGGGAADGGRDLEAHFYAPTADGELEAQRWWIECKGRAGTVEPDEVKSALNNATAIEGLDYIVIATNTQFSNPTRDWVSQWQTRHTRPKVKLWDRTQLERYLSRHPDVVLRLFAKALSLDGRFKAMEQRFWNRLEFVPLQTLRDLWEGRCKVELSAMGLFAAIANEIIHGSVTKRPWAATLDTESLLAVISIGCQNVLYLSLRCSDAGVDQGLIFRSLSYLVVVALHRLPAETVADFIMLSIARRRLSDMPEEAQEILLKPLLAQIQFEIQDVCSRNCKRISYSGRAAPPETTDEVRDFWIRLEPEGLVKPEPHNANYLLIEKLDEPCVVGFPVGKDQGCPLFALEPSVKSAGEILAVIKRVIDFRSAENAAKQTEKESKDKRTHTK